MTSNHHHHHHQSSSSRYEIFCQPLYLIVAGGLNLPPVFFGILGITTWCSNFSGWLMTNGAMCLLNMLAALYVVFKLRKSMAIEASYNDRQSTTSSDDDGVDHVFDKELEQGRRPMCYDSRSSDDEIESSSADESSSSDDAESSSSDDDEQQQKQHNVPVVVVDDVPVVAVVGETTINTNTIERQQPMNTTNNNTSSSVVVSKNNRNVNVNNDDDNIDVVLGSPPPQHHMHHTHTTPGGGRRQSCFRRLLRRRSKTSDRVRHLICYDTIVATYCILFLFWIVWLSDGTQRWKSYFDYDPQDLQQQQQDDMEEEDGWKNCRSYHVNYVHTSLKCGFIYMVCTIMFLIGCLLS